jgi:hypothetical protein
MHWPSRVILAGVAGVAGVAAIAAIAGAAASARGADQAGGAAPAATPAPIAPASGPGDGYLGSAACQRCHETEYGTWRKTLHVQMTKPVREATIEGDFRPGTHLEQYGRAYRMEARDGRYFITVGRGSGGASGGGRAGDRPAETFEISYTLGARRFQGYLSKLPDGRIYVLPVFWHNESKRWVDWKEITPIPDDASHDLRQIWNVTCVNCHATNLVKNYNPVTDTYATTWTEMGLGCEACHGPGQPHVALMDEWNRSPGSKPKYDNRPSNHERGRVLRIFAPKSAAPREIFDACGYCHGNKNNSFFGFKPGDRYEDYALPFLISEPIPRNDPQGEFWPDGRPSRFNRPQALTLTGCFRKGEATCTSCHRMHGSNDHLLKVPVEQPGGGHTKQSDLLCTQCHTVGPAEPERSAAGAGPAGSAEGVSPARIPDLAAHTHHAPDSQASRCVECHMSDVNWRLITRRRDHTFQPPVPEMTSRYGVPNACTTCHEDKTPEWAASRMDTWYGNGGRRRAVVATADVLYRAGAGDTSVLGDVVRLAVDRSRGALIRASAAEFAGQLLARGATGSRGAEPATTPADGPGLDPVEPVAPVNAAVANALIGAAADPEPVVRTMAVRALALTRDPRVGPVLAAHLTDEARLVRVSAVEGLTGLGITRLDGPAGDALARAQDDWATSLATFNDIAGDHTTLGWLLAARGRAEDAEKELSTAIALDAGDPRPHVYLGILAARAGSYDEALRQFKIAKTIAPSYKNLDLLILEAQKR